MENERDLRVASEVWDMLSQKKGKKLSCRQRGRVTIRVVDNFAKLLYMQSV